MSGFVAQAGVTMLAGGFILLYFIMWASLKSAPNRVNRSNRS